MRGQSCQRQVTRVHQGKLSVSPILSASQNSKAELITLEIGCLGRHVNDLFCALKHLAPLQQGCQLQDHLSRSVIASSYMIFKAH